MSSLNIKLHTIAFSYKDFFKTAGFYFTTFDLDRSSCKKLLLIGQEYPIHVMHENLLNATDLKLQSIDLQLLSELGNFAWPNFETDEYSAELVKAYRCVDQYKSVQLVRWYECNLPENLVQVLIDYATKSRYHAFKAIGFVEIACFLQELQLKRRYIFNWLPIRYLLITQQIFDVKSATYDNVSNYLKQLAKDKVHIDTLLKQLLM